LHDKVNSISSNKSSPNTQDKISVCNIDLLAEKSFKASINNQEKECSPCSIPNELRPLDYVKREIETKLMSQEVSAAKSKLSITPSMLELYKNADKIDFQSFLISVSYYIIVISGYQKTAITSCEKYDLHKKTWKECNCISHPKTKFSAISYSNSKVLILGGKLGNGRRTDLIEEYDITNNSWSVFASKLTSGRSSFGLTSDDNGLFMAGGSDGNILNVFQYFRLTSNEWILLPDMMHKREEFGLVMGPDNIIYAIGGFDGKECLNKAERYIIQSKTWESIAPLNIARRSLSVVVLPDGIYALGGYDGKHFLSSVEK